ncbi:MAG: TlpA family protein disulfide reductase [Candidatus Paracaedibacteraceae bacterium]|nr:TlpA family protein disulfide reductase [Candidatus Paracaedibacteraceae bacterium]
MVATNKSFWVGVILSPLFMALIWFAVNKPKVDVIQPQPIVATFDFVPTAGNVILPSATFEKLNLVDGTTSTVSFADLAGKPMIIHYWATWCGACVEEIPALVKFAEQNAENIRFVIIASDHSGGREVKAYCDKNDIKNIDIYIDKKGSVLKGQSVKALPTTVFASANQVEAGRVVGAIDWLGQSGSVIQGYLTKGA